MRETKINLPLKVCELSEHITIIDAYGFMLFHYPGHDRAMADLIVTAINCHDELKEENAAMVRQLNDMDHRGEAKHRVWNAAMVDLQSEVTNLRKERDDLKGKLEEAIASKKENRRLRVESECERDELKKANLSFAASSARTTLEIAELRRKLTASDDAKYGPDYSDVCGPTAEEVFNEAVCCYQNEGTSDVKVFIDWYNSRIKSIEEVERPLREEIEKLNKQVDAMHKAGLGPDWTDITYSKQSKEIADLKRQLAEAHSTIRRCAVHAAPSSGAKLEQVSSMPLDDVPDYVNDRVSKLECQLAEAHKETQQIRAMQPCGPTAEEVKDKLLYLLFRNRVEEFMGWYNSSVKPTAEVERPLREEIAYLKSDIDNAVEQAKEACPDYPWIELPSRASQAAWAACQSCKGLQLACDDLHKIVADLKRQLAEALKENESLRYESKALQKELEATDKEMRQIRAKQPCMTEEEIRNVVADVLDDVDDSGLDMVCHVIASKLRDGQKSPTYGQLFMEITTALADRIPKAGPDRWERIRRLVELMRKNGVDVPAAELCGDGSGRISDASAYKSRLVVWTGDEDPEQVIRDCIKEHYPDALAKHDAEQAKLKLPPTDDLYRKAME